MRSSEQVSGALTQQQAQQETQQVAADVTGATEAASQSIQQRTGGTNLAHISNPQLSVAAAQHDSSGGAAGAATHLSATSSRQTALGPGSAGTAAEAGPESLRLPATYSTARSAEHVEVTAAPVSVAASAARVHGDVAVQGSASGTVEPSDAANIVPLNGEASPAAAAQPPMHRSHRQIKREQREAAAAAAAASVHASLQRERAAVRFRPDPVAVAEWQPPSTARESFQQQQRRRQHQHGANRAEAALTREQQGLHVAHRIDAIPPPLGLRGAHRVSGMHSSTHNTSAQQPHGVRQHFGMQMTDRAACGGRKRWQPSVSMICEQPDLEQPSAAGDTLTGADTAQSVVEVMEVGDGSNRDSEDTVRRHFADLLRVANDKVPVQQLDEAANVRGQIYVDTGFKFVAKIQSVRAWRAVEQSGKLFDTGAEMSVVSERFVKQLRQAGALSTVDVWELRQPRRLAGYNGEAMPEPVTKAVLLRLDVQCKDGATVIHPFMIVPRATTDLILGRDFLNLHKYEAAGEPGKGAVYRFGSGDSRAFLPLSIAPIELRKVEPKAYKPAASEGWKVVVKQQVCIDSGQLAQKLYLQVVAADGHSIVNPPAQHGHDQQVWAEFTHPCIATEGVATAYSCTPVVVLISSGCGDTVLEVGDVVGDARALVPVQQGKEDGFGADAQHADGTVASYSKLQAAALYCGAGGLAHGLREHVNVRLAVDSSAEACAIFHSNAAEGAEVLQRDLTQQHVRDEVVGRLDEARVEVVIAGPPTQQFSLAEQRQTAWDVQHLYYALEAAARAKHVRMLLLESMKSLQDAAEVENLLTLAASAGFSVQHAYSVSGSDCKLAHKSSRLFHLLIRPDERSDVPVAAQRSSVAVKQAAAMMQLLRGQAGHETVRGAIERYDAEAVTSERVRQRDSSAARQHYFLKARTADGQQVFDMDKAAPTLRQKAWQQQRRPHDVTYTPRRCDAAQTRDAAARADYLSWSEMKAITSFMPAFSWPEPSAETADAHARLLVDAVPPVMAEHLGSVLHSTGVWAAVAQLAPTLDPSVQSRDVQWRHIGSVGFERTAAAKAQLGASFNSRVGEKDVKIAQVAAKAAANSADAVRQQLQQQLGAGLNRDAAGNPTIVMPPAGGAPLATYKHSDAAVNKVLAKARATLPDYVQQLRVDLEGWSAPQVQQLCDLMQKYMSTLLSSSKWDVGYCDTLPFRVELKPDAKPARDRPYRYSPRMTDLVKVEIDKLLAAGIIRPSLSEWASPVVAVLKPDGTARITVNYRKLNAQTVVPQIPLPHIEDLLNSLGGSAIFTTMDITSGYFTSAIDADTIPLTAMVTSFGLYEWTRCPQGAAGAPGHFTRLMQMVLAGLERVQPFIDDVIVNSSSVDQHLSDLGALFGRLVKHGMKLVPAKIHVGCRHVKFLGHIVGVDGIRPDPSKVQALIDMPMPSNLGQLRSWLGLASYYRRFVRDMSKKVAPLTKLMTKDAEFNMGPEQQQAVRTVNEALAVHTLMRYPDHAAAAAADSKRPFVLATDACKDGFGAVLSQADENGVEQPIAFASRATVASEKRWSTTDLEAGAIVFGVKKFRHMLWGCPFVLYTDHRALQYMESLREKTARGARWSEFLQAFPHTIKYRKGSANSNADATSRNPIPATAADEAEEQREQLVEAYSIDVTTDKQLYQHLQQAYVHIQQLVSDVLEGAEDEAAAAAAAGGGCAGIQNNEFAARHVRLGQMSAADWQQQQAADPQLQQIIQHLQGEAAADQPAGTAARVAKWARDCQLRMLGGSQLLVRLEWPRGDAEHAGTPYEQIVVPKALRNDVLDSMHGSAWAGHQGKHKTMERLRQHCWWPSWASDTQFWVEHCWPCQARKGSGRLAHWPMVWRHRPPFPFHTVGVDLFGPLPTSAAGDQHILVFVDLYSGWVELYALTAEQNNAIGIAEKLVHDFSTRHGVPLRLLSDRGSQFMSELARQVYYQMGIAKLSTTPFHPQTNGKTERFMQSLAQMLAMVVDSAAADWHIWLRHVAFAYNNSVHAVTGASPFMFVTGRQPRVALHSLLGQLRHDSIAAGIGGVHEAVRVIMQRQREAEVVMDRRRDLHYAKVMRQNSTLAAAFGSSQNFKAGEKVWLYRKPRTHDAAAQSDEGITRATFSKKLLDLWQGPFEVVRVGPWSAADSSEHVQANCLLINIGGHNTRVSATQCKVCRDPWATRNKPETLPDGFARYLIAKQWGGKLRDSISSEEVAPRTERHGVEAILQHRLVHNARGRGRALEYLVRWEGAHVGDTWEPAHFLDACDEALTEYWSTAGQQAADSSDGGVEVVQQQRQRAAKRLQASDCGRATCGIGTYTLPSDRVLVRKVTCKQLTSHSLLNMRILQVYKFDANTSNEHVRWCEGVVRKLPATSRGGNAHRIYWVEDGSETSVVLALAYYTVKPNAREGSWFISGSASQVTRLCK